VAEVCDIYLAHAAATGAKSTYYNRANSLFDFCYALPARFRRKDGQPADYTEQEKEAMRKERCQHPPYGQIPVGKLTACMWTAGSIRTPLGSMAAGCASTPSNGP
jgi:hypothetical protein